MADPTKADDADWLTSMFDMQADLSKRAVTEANRLRRRVRDLEAQLARERADCDRKLALQKASYEREIATEVEAEREACAQLCDSMQYADEQTPMNCAEAIRARGVTDIQIAQSLRAFAQAVMEGWPENGGLDGGDLQDLAVKHGLLQRQEPPPREPCGDGCTCAEYYEGFDFEDGAVECYRKTPLLTGDADIRAAK